WLLAWLVPGTLLLCDLGYFAFEWFDQLTQKGVFFVSRMREGTSFVTHHVLYEGTQNACRLRESLVYLGKYRANHAAHPVRLIELTWKDRTWRFITNVLDPLQLPA